MSVSLADLCAEDSDSDDEEYVPEGKVTSDESESADDTEEIDTSKKGKKTTSKKRKRGKGPTEEVEEDEEGEDPETVLSKEEAEKKEAARIDDLWASFKKDTDSGHSKASMASPVVPPAKKVKVKETYDFAGEEVTVEKEVDAASKEAKKLLASQAEVAEVKSETVVKPETKSSPALRAELSEELASQTVKSARPQPSVKEILPETKSMALPKKKSSGLSSVLSSIGKKPKMSTLEKSSLDWNKYKQDHGLEEELARHSKDGYLEKQEFLHRSDVRQFELEREQRLKRFKKFL